MNKKFLSAILLGALAVSAGSFVSCKDYDDDIDNLRKEIANMSSIKADASALSSAIDAAKAALQSDIKTAAQQAVADAKSQALEEAKKEIAKIETGASMEEVQAAISNAIAKIEACNCDVDGKIAAAIEKLAIDAKMEAALATLEQKIKTDMAALYLQQDALNGYAKLTDLADFTKKTEFQNAINSVTTALTVAQQNVDSKLADAVKAAKDAAAASVAKVNSELVVLTSALRSLVFQPEFYVDGIEAAQYQYLRYAALDPDKDAYPADPTLKKNDKGNKVELMATPFKDPNNLGTYTVTQYYHLGEITDNLKPGAAGTKAESDLANTWTKSNEFWGTVKNVGIQNQITYALNPSNAQIKKEDLTVVCKNILAMTRAGEAKVTVNDFEVKNGYLTVFYTVDDPTKLITADNQEDQSVVNGKPNTTIFELEVANGDTVINSEWAALYETLTQPVAIAWNKAGDAKAAQKAPYCDVAGLYKELYKNPYEALAQPASLGIKWDDAKGFDLKELLCIHMVDMDEDRVGQNDDSKDGHPTKPAEISKHKEISLADAEKKYGLTVSFAPVSYTTESAGNKTQPSNYINPGLGENGHIVAGTVVPKSSVEDGEFDPKQGISSVGKQPLVQVLVKKGNDVVLEGYIKLEITKIDVNQPDKVTAVIDLGEKTYNCAGVTARMTWSQASTIMLQNTLGIDKKTFDDTYQLLTRADGKCAIEFADTLNDKQLDIKNAYAIIREVVDTEGTTNTVLEVALDKYAQRYIIEDLGGKANFIVKYYPKAITNPAKFATMPGVFVRVSITLKDDPNALLTMKTKIREYWYKNGTEVNGVSDTINNNTDLNVIRLNVNYPKDNKNSYNTDAPTYEDGTAAGDGFVRDLRSAFEVAGADNDIVLMKGSTAYADTRVKKNALFYFHPAINGTKFKGDDGKTYQLSVDYDFVRCGKWIAGDGPEYMGDSHRETLAKLYHEVKDLSKQPLNYIETLAQSNKLDATVGIFQNTKLYVSINDAAPVVVATIKPTTGEIYYNHSTEAQQLINAVGHLAAKAKVYVGVYSLDGTCNDVLAVKDGVFPAYFLRPLDVNNAKAKEVTDAEANGSVTALADLVAFKDWREVEIDKTKNGWLLAYYGVNKITVDLTNVTTNLNGYDITSKKLSDVTKKAKISLVDDKDPAVATVLADMDEATTEPFKYSGACTIWPTYCVEKTYSNATGSAEVFAKVFDKLFLKYENNGLNVYDWTIRIPVTVGYDWGEFSTYVDVKIVKTLGNN